MEYRKLGKSGLRIGAVSLGGWITFGGTIDEDRARSICRTAVDGGVNYLDFADVYALGKAEEVMGRLLPDYTRANLVLASKLFWPMSDDVNDRGLSRKHIMQSVEGSLRRLGTEYLDFYFCHREDLETDLEETVRAMDDLVHQGKILHWGTSVWSDARLNQAFDLCSAKGFYAPAVEQPPFNLMERGIEADVLSTCIQNGAGVVVWSPLAGGLLTGKYDSGAIPPGSRAETTRWLDGKLTSDTLKRLSSFSAMARDLGLEPSQLALAWILSRDGITSVITGATRPEQVTMNLKAADVQLEADTLAALDGLFPART